MKKIFFPALISAMVVSLGCDSKKEDVKAETVPVSTSTTEVNALPQTTSTVTTSVAVPTTTTTNAIQPIVAPNVSTTNTIQKPPTTTVATGLNPAHGEPGHRCDISVGAPLNGAANKTPATTPAISTTIPANQSPVVINSAPTVTAPAIITTPVTTVAAGMNPAHGQPGHRCDISVGAPLSTAPALKPSLTTTPVAITPVKKDN